MILLFQFPTTWGLPNLSPPCVKVETFLRMAKIPYQVKWSFNLKKAPKGKLPYIIDDGRKIADSALIIDYLEEKYDVHLDQSLSGLEKSISLAFRRMIEEHLYWCGVYWRWKEDLGWTHTEPAFFQHLKWPVRGIASRFVRQHFLKQLHSQGVGRHSPLEVHQMAIENLQAISHFLADKKFMMGAKPTHLDASAYAILINILDAPIENEVKQAARKMVNLVRYKERMKKRFYQDFK